MFNVGCWKLNVRHLFSPFFPVVRILAKSDRRSEAPPRCRPEDRRRHCCRGGGELCNLLRNRSLWFVGSNSEHPTLNAKHPTLNVSRSMFNVGRWKFNVRHLSPSSQQFEYSRKISESTHRILWSVLSRLPDLPLAELDEPNVTTARFRAALSDRPSTYGWNPSTIPPPELRHDWETEKFLSGAVALPHDCRHGFSPSRRWPLWSMRKTKEDVLPDHSLLPESSLWIL